ncbi:MAG: HEAT repeat domain-containing protein [Planctomycetota bacterium]
MLTPLTLTLLTAAAPWPAEAHGQIALPATEPAPTAAQDAKDEEEEKPDEREEIEEALDSLKDHVRARGDEDKQAISIIDDLLVEFPKSGPKDRKDIVAGIAACLKVKRKDLDADLKNNGLFIASATALGDMGPESVKPLLKWHDHKSFSKDLATQRALLLALGKTRDEDVVEPLVDLLPHHLPEVQAAAGEALGNFAHLDQKVRKDIFKEVLDELTAVKNRVDVDQVDQIEIHRYNTISGPMLTTLESLSGYDSRNPLEYRTWWNDNKKKNWDEGRKG